METVRYEFMQFFHNGIISKDLSIQHWYQYHELDSILNHTKTYCAAGISCLHLSRSSMGKSLYP